MVACRNIVINSLQKGNIVIRGLQKGNIVISCFSSSPSCEQ